MIIKTGRLIIRPPQKKDVKDLVEGLNNLNVAKFLSTVPYPYKKKDAVWWINDCKKKGKYSFSIELKSENKIIGGIGFHDVDKKNQSAEIGFWVNEKYWGRGIISEAITAMLNSGFNKLKLRRIVQKAYIENKASNHIAKKLGYKFEGTERKSIKAKSTKKVHNCNVYSMLKEEWRKK